MLKWIHAFAGGSALLLISTFWTSSLLVEVFGSPETVAVVKTAVLWAMLALVPSLAVTGISGAVLGKGWKGSSITRKQMRMKAVAANGLLILLPSAFFLAMKAQADSLDVWFFLVQVLELTAGAVNISLLGLNMRDGLALSRRRARPVGARQV